MYDYNLSVPRDSRLGWAVDRSRRMSHHTYYYLGARAQKSALNL